MKKSFLELRGSHGNNKMLKEYSHFKIKFISNYLFIFNSHPTLFINIPYAANFPLTALALLTINPLVL